MPEKPLKLAKLKPIVEAGGKLYEGQDHGQAIHQAQADGQDISMKDREKEGKFKTPDGRILTREEAKKEFNVEHSADMKHKIEIITDEWLAPSLALTLKNEGCDVSVALKRPTNILKGTINRIPYAERLEYAKNCDLIIYEDKSGHNESRDLRASGKSVIGGCELSDKLELKRAWANKVAKLAGLKVPEMIEVDDFNQIREIIKERGGRWVLKQCGKIDEIKGLNFVSKMPDSEDLLDFLPILEKNWIDGVKKDFVLQEKVEGYEMAVGSYWNGHEFMKDKDGDEICEENWEHKALMTGNMGESTGEMFTVLKYEKALNSKLFKETLDKCREILKHTDFRGDFDVNTIVTEKGAYFLENTPRLGVPATSGQLEIHKSSWYSFLKAMADGKQDSKFDYDPRYCIVSWLYTKPFPFVNSHKMTALYESEKPNTMEEICEIISFKMSNSEGILLNFTKDFTKEDWTHIHPDGLRFQDGRLKIANPDGYVLTASAQDDTVEGAGEKLVKLFDKIKIPKGFYRNDFSSSNFHKAKEDLTKWGYILPEEEKPKILKTEKKERVRKQVRAKLKKLI